MPSKNWTMPFVRFASTTERRDEKFGAKFTDTAGVGGYGEWENIADEIVAEVACRTPGFSGWQQERWFTHCGDAGEFLGAAGEAELRRDGSEAVEAVRNEAGLSGEDWRAYLQALDKESSPTAYIFKCLHLRRVRRLFGLRLGNAPHEQVVLRRPTAAKCRSLCVP